MAPMRLLGILQPRGPASSSSIWDIVRSQWEIPGDILSVLLLVGGDVVQTALAQLVGHGLTPVLFSFGWLPYTVTATLSAAAGRALMPALPDFSAAIIHVQSGFARDNQSWLLGRLLRDFEQWRPRESIPREDGISMCALGISVFNATEKTGDLVRDWVWYVGLFVMPVQLGVAIIPGVLHQNWSPVIITGAGTLLAFITGALPQWRQEKSAYRRGSRSDIVLTQGNGSRTVLVIRGRGLGFELQDMAFSGGHPLPFTVLYFSVLTVLWLALLITVAGLKQDTWYLLGVGFIGIVQNAVVGAVGRHPSAYGVHLDFVETIAQRKVMPSLMEAESRYPGLGLCLLNTFFPGELRHDEEVWWDKARMMRRDR